MNLRVFVFVSWLMLGAASLLLGQSFGKDSDCSITKPQPIRALAGDKHYRDAYPTVSPDGQQVVFARRSLHGDAKWGLWVAPFAGGEPRPLTPEDFSYDCTTPSWSPDGRVIAFRASPAEADSPGGIWLMTPEGNALRPLTDEKRFDDYHPAWSRDGKWFALHRAVIGEWNYDVWKVSLDGAEQRITSHEKYDGRTAVSPNGKQIAFASNRDGTLNIWILNTEDGEKSAKQFTFKQGRAPAWSSDGNWIAFASNRAGSYAIYLKPVSGGCAIQVTDGNEFHPVWSRDGNWLVVDTAPDKEKSRILVVDVGHIVGAAQGNSNKK